jgi:hypothetical protein
MSSAWALGSEITVRGFSAVIAATAPCTSHARSFLVTSCNL